MTGHIPMISLSPSVQPVQEVRCPQCDRFFFEIEVDLPEGMPAGSIRAKRIKCSHCRQWVQGVVIVRGPIHRAA